MDLQTIILIATPVATATSAVMGIRYGLNGMREGLRRTEDKLDEHVADFNAKHTDVVERLAKVETKVERKD